MAYSEYPTGNYAATTRVGSVTRRYNRDEGTYRLELTLGGIEAKIPGVQPAIKRPAAEDFPIPSPVALKQERDLLRTWKPFADAFAGLGLTTYGKARAQELYEMGLIDAEGKPTEYGRKWIETHPTEEPPRPRTSKTSLGDLYYDTLSELALLTSHTTRTMAQLYAAGFVDAEGRITEKGHQWIREHPTESFGLEAV